MASMRLLLWISLIGLILPVASCLKDNYPTGEIDVFDKVTIGGLEQWYIANGQSSDLPVLLWLHGGPGAAHMPVARHFNSNLEQEFIVVHWDQRGAGKSNPVDFDESTMTFDRFVTDVLEMTEFLKNKFGKRKIYLLGHSWGSQLGLVVANLYPYNYFAYIGVSQLVDSGEAQIIAHRELTKRIVSRQRKKDLANLQALQGPPYRKHSEYVSFARMMGQYGMNMDIGMTRLIMIVLRSNLYSVGDMMRWLEGAQRGSGPMWSETQKMNMIERVNAMDIPCFFIAGEEDFNTPAILARRLLDRIESNHKKELIIIEKAAHTPFFADPARFYQELKRIKKVTYLRHEPRSNN